MHGGKSIKRRTHDIVLRNALKCGYCGKVITWEKHKGHYYGTCHHITPHCKKNKYLREDIAQDVLVEKMGNLISPSKAVVDWLIKYLDDDFKYNSNQAEDYKQSIKTRLSRLEKMDEMLYDDKLAGEVTKERYDSKHADILKQIEQLKDDLIIADSTSSEKHQQVINLIKLTQTAKDEYLSENLTNEQKRTILAELFESVDYEDNSISVKLTKFVKSIEEKVYISKQLLKEAKMNCRTNKNDPINRGQTVENAQLKLLCPVWQGHVESNHDLRFWRPIY